MSASTAPDRAQDHLVEAARAGDHDAFQALVAPYSRALHVHSYRLLGSFHDAEEATQETLLRAWRSLHTFEGRAPLRAWLYRIATTTSLKMLQARARRPVPADPDAEVSYLQPYPDRLLDELDAGGDPAALAERRESIGLAFVAAVQRLPARQRAALLLRDVLDWSAAEVAELLETTVPAVNSALQRARETMHRASSDPAGAARPLSEAEQDVVRRFVLAWERCDIAGLAAQLRDDAVLSMPPESAVIRGREAVAGFFGSVPEDGRLDRIPLVLTRANGQPALAAYLESADGVLEPYGIMVLAVAGGLISRITGFPDPAMFQQFALSAPPGLDGAGHI